MSECQIHESDSQRLPTDGNLQAIVDLGALRHNLALIRRSVGPTTDVIACVKANAYGHGLSAVARCLEGEGVRWLSVGSAAEALALRASGVACRVLLFPALPREHVGKLTAAGITIGVQSYVEAERIARSGEGQGSIFLKVDAGFGRVGVPLSDAVSVARRIKALRSVTLDGVFTHLPFAKPETIGWVEARLGDFATVAAAIREIHGADLVVQALASTGTVLGLEAPGTNAVCPGQLLFGIEPEWARQVTGRDRFGTKPVLSAVTTVIGAFRSLPEGARFGAGGAKVAGRNTRLGVLPIGYSNSILVQKPGQLVHAHGRSAPVLGISLEHAVVDVTDIPELEEGERVTLLADDGRVATRLDDLARTQGRTSLEVLVSLTGRTVYEYADSATSGRADG